MALQVEAQVLRIPEPQIPVDVPPFVQDGWIIVAVNRDDSGDFWYHMTRTTYV